MFVIKYKVKDNEEHNIWGYISNIGQMAIKEIDKDKYIKEYNDTIKNEKINQDICEYMDGKKLSKNIADTNKVFSIVSDEIKNNVVGNTHYENLIDENSINMPIYTILLYVEDSKEFDNIVLITNQEVYLMNDKGQTIERLV